MAVFKELLSETASVFVNYFGIFDRVNYFNKTTELRRFTVFCEIFCMRNILAKYLAICDMILFWHKTVWFFLLIKRRQRRKLIVISLI